MYIFDIATNYQLGFQDPATPIQTGISDLHDSIFFYLIFILIGVIYFLVKIISRSITQWENPNKEHILNFRNNVLEITNLVHGTAIEIIWTITPAIILMMIAVPSFALLYSIDEIIDPVATLKITGSQWFWTYEYIHPELDAVIKADSYMKPTDELYKGEFRLLEVDQPLTCPIEWHLRLLITASDVLHSFAVPSLGIKVDAVPGRLNQTSLYIQREGVYYGQCSELCGVNHGFMPIKIEAIADDSNDSIYDPLLMSETSNPQITLQKKPENKNTQTSSTQERTKATQSKEYLRHDAAVGKIISEIKKEFASLPGRSLSPIQAWEITHETCKKWALQVQKKADILSDLGIRYTHLLYDVDLATKPSEAEMQDHYLCMANEYQKLQDHLINQIPTALHAYLSPMILNNPQNHFINLCNEKYYPLNPETQEYEYKRVIPHPKKEQKGNTKKQK